MSTIKMPAPHFTAYIAHRIATALKVPDRSISDGPIIEAVGDTTYANALIGSREIIIVDFQGKHYRVLIEELRPAEDRAP